MSRRETAEKLKKIALEATWASERIKAMEALGEMGEVWLQREEGADDSCESAR